VNLAPAVQHGCRSAGLACPLGSSTAAGSSVRPNQGLKARSHALNRFALPRKRGSRARGSSLISDHPPPSLTPEQIADLYIVAATAERLAVEDDT
jgi:hypothetical protein